MTDLFLLSRVQMRRIERYFPLSHGIARVDDRRIVSAIVFVIKNGYRQVNEFGVDDWVSAGHVDSR
jgi:putative transposase